jgi:hypothetical protein
MTENVVYDSGQSDETNIEALKQYFKIVEKPEKVFKLYCKRCQAGWQLDNRKGAHPGNMLHLLNHAYGHLKR